MAKDELKICQICGGPLDAPVVYCARCKTPHHLDCWEYNGKCSTFGCKSTVYSAKPQKHRIQISTDDHLKIDGAGVLWIEDKLVVVEKKKRKRRKDLKGRAKPSRVLQYRKAKNNNVKKKSSEMTFIHRFSQTYTILGSDEQPKFRVNKIPYCLSLGALFLMLYSHSTGFPLSGISLLWPFILWVCSVVTFLYSTFINSSFILDSGRKIICLTKSFAGITKTKKICSLDDIVKIGVGYVFSGKSRYAVLVELEDHSCIRIGHLHESYHDVNQLARTLARYIEVPYELAHSSIGSLTETENSLTVSDIDHNEQIPFSPYEQNLTLKKLVTTGNILIPLAGAVLLFLL